MLNMFIPSLCCYLERIEKLNLIFFISYKDVDEEVSDSKPYSDIFRIMRRLKEIDIIFCNYSFIDSKNEEQNTYAYIKPMLEELKKAKNSYKIRTNSKMVITTCKE